MKKGTLTVRSLTYFWRTHAAVVIGVATAIAVLTGALLVGDSVRGSLRDLVVLRLGETDQVVISTGFFGEDLAEEIQADPDFNSRFRGITPIILAEGFVRTQTGSGRAGPVAVYGVDSRFWEFHGMGGISGPDGRQARLSPTLAADLGVGEGDTILVRLQKPTDMPVESVYGEKDDLGQTVRATVETILPREELGEFSLAATQGEVRAVFLPLALLQTELEVDRRVTALLVSGGTDEAAAVQLEQLVRSAASLEDIGLGIRTTGDPPTLVIESAAGLLENPVAEAVLAVGRRMGLEPRPLLTYLANTIEADGSGIPYSLVTATDLAALAPELDVSGSGGLPPIVLNEWAARELGIAAGTRVSLEYYLWQEPGRLLTRAADFVFAGSVEVNRGDPDMAPDYPGISDSTSLADWDPPFPIDLGRVRPVDEDYWDLYRTTPKAFVSLETGQELWRSRYGALTSIRFPGDEGVSPDALAEELALEIDPLAAGLTVVAVRAEGLDASQGAVNFSEYFVYFSFFLVTSALLLAALFFKLSVEQRAVEIGVLRAMGFGPGNVRQAFLKESLGLSLAGAILGVIGGIGYAWLIVRALGTWWVGAVGTTHLTLHISGLSLGAGIVGGIAASLGCMWITLRSLSRVSARRLLAGQLGPEAETRSRGRSMPAALAFAFLGVVLIAATLAGLVPQAGGFFGAGAAFLVTCLSLFLHWTRQPVGKALDGKSPWPVLRLGLRNVTWRPARSVVSVAMIASATFILVSVDAFRTDSIRSTGSESGIGGYSLIVETLVPLVYDPDSPEGRDTLGIDGFDSVSAEPFRLRPGDDASCLNLYAPQNPRIVAPRDSFLAAGRFRFSDSLAETPQEEANPWLLLEREFDDGAIPVIADKHSITYVLNRRLGDDIVVTEGDRPVRLRLVAALDDSIFQGELLMSEANFRNAFPDLAGYGYLLVEDEAGDVGALEDAIGDALEDHGARITSTAGRLAEFHQVENTYLSTFQALGALGLLLGTVGLGAVLLRNVLERRQELALLRALGYRQPDFVAMALAENTTLLVGGLLTGVVCALLAIGPALAERGGRLPGGLLLLLLCGVLGLGLITSLVATIAALRSPLLAALRSE